MPQYEQTAIANLANATPAKDDANLVLTKGAKNDKPRPPIRINNRSMHHVSRPGAASLDVPRLHYDDGKQEMQPI